MRDSVRPLPDPIPYLEHYPEPGGTVHRIELEPVPFRLGRSSAAQFTVPCRQVSKEHAEIYREESTYRVRDLGSTNGTFVNGQRVTDAPLTNGDILHIAHKEFRFGHEPGTAPGVFVTTCTDPAESRVPPSLIKAHGYLQEMLATYGCSISFQPIVDLATGAPVGYEALARGGHEHLSTSPAELLRLAERCGLARDLSRMFCSIAVQEAASLAEGTLVFLNMHPSEIKDPELFVSLAELPALAGPGQRLIVEVHKSVVVDTPSLRKLRDELNALGIGLAYDDFGRGQARFAELVEVPPDFLKLDMNLVRNIHKDTGRQQLVRSLNQVIHGLGVQVIAAGVETKEEADTCAGLGCHHGQGYLFGRPQLLPPTTLSANSAPWREYLPLSRPRL